MKLEKYYINIKFHKLLKKIKVTGGVSTDGFLYNNVKQSTWRTRTDNSFVFVFLAFRASLQTQYLNWKR